MLLQKKTVDPLMESVMAELMRADKPLPLGGQLAVNHNEPPSQFPVIESLGGFAEIEVADMNAKGPGKFERAAGLIFSD
jgi:hypothetical protein